jgi:2-keto-4-pentenoate hydratase
MDVDAAAEFLSEHRRTGVVVDDLPAGLRPADLADAYRVQDALVARLLRGEGDRAIGYKVACTNAIAQEALQIDRPLFGRLLASSTHASPARLEASRFTTRVIEAEFGVRMAADVPPGSGPHTAGSVAAYVGDVVASIEVVDHRFVDWSVGALSVAADNAIHGCWVHAEPTGADWRTLDLATHEVRVTVDGAEATTGNGAAVLGHPLNVVAWLADELPRYGRQLLVGDHITTGVCTDVFQAGAPSAIVADFGVLGRVELTWC